MQVIIVGAGAAGLMAAKQLSQAGFSVLILEARNRVGGRIYTFKEKGYEDDIEAGAEFIHGNLKVTLELLKEAGLNKQAIQGDVYQVTKGHWKQENDFFEMFWQE